MATRFFPTMSDCPDGPVYVAGHQGMVGSAIVRALNGEGQADVITRSRQALDLTRQADVEEFFAEAKPAWVFLAAARVGGILANDRHPADFIRDNLLIQNNVIDAARRFGVRKLLFLGSSCIYPRDTAQPIAEQQLLSGPLEATNEWYAIAKIAGIKLCQAYRRQHGFDAISLMPTNLYGPGDNFDLAGSHVLPALMRKFHEARLAKRDVVEIWGSGRPRREFLHVDDLASACLFLMRCYSSEEIVNVGTGRDIAISELAELMAEITGFGGALAYDDSKPDGTPRKLLNTAKLSALGWSPAISLREGIEHTYQWFLEHQELARGMAALSV